MTPCKKLYLFRIADNRFEIVAGDDSGALLEWVDASSTKRCTATAVYTFREYLSAILKTLHVVSSTYVLQFLHREENRNGEIYRNK